MFRPAWVNASMFTAQLSAPWTHASLDVWNASAVGERASLAKVARPKPVSACALSACDSLPPTPSPISVRLVERLDSRIVFGACAVAHRGDDGFG